ncbi:MAG: 50S ribosomal protein L10 [Actinomycetota bacterium]
MPRAEKEERVRGLAERLSAASAAVLTDYRGLSVKDAAELRAALAQVDARFSIVKNTLTKLAVKEAGLEGLAEFVDGPTAIAFILGDPVAGTKRLVEESRRLPVLEVRGGFAEGRILSADQIRELAALESREVMLARIAGLGKVQLSRAAWMFQALQARFLLALQALADKLPEEPAAEPVEAAAGEPSEEPSAAEDERPAEMPEAPAEGAPGPAETETEPRPQPEAPAEEPAETGTEPGPEPEAPAEEPEAPAGAAQAGTETEPTEGGA